LIDRASSRPWLGHGFSGFWTADHIEEISDMFYWHIPSGHSIYIDLVLALGLVGLALYLGIIALGLRRALAAYQRFQAPEYVYAVSLLLLSLVHGFAESKFAGVGLSAFSVFSVVASLCRTDVSRRQQQETLA
jgi:O-antigen ligase